MALKPDKEYWIEQLLMILENEWIFDLPDHEKDRRQHERNFN